MYVPSSKIWELLKVEQAGAWLDQSPDSPGFAMFAKLPMNVIRAINLQAKVSLATWIIDIEGKRVAAFGLQVDDQPDHPAVFFGPCRDDDELRNLRSLVATETTFPLQVHNEVFIPLLRMKCRLGTAPSRSTVEALEAEFEYIKSHDTRTRSLAMDVIASSLKANAAPDRRIRMSCVQEIFIGGHSFKVG